MHALEIGAPRGLMKQVIVEVHGGKRFTYREVRQVDASDKFKLFIHGKEGVLTIINKWAVQRLWFSETETLTPLGNPN